MKPCNQCGKCCINYSDGGLSATADEIEYWELFRPEIARYVNNGNIWMDPSSGAQLEICPWLRKGEGKVETNGKPKEIYSCDIYHDRPNDCKAYPVDLSQMINDECEMLEADDIANPKRGYSRLKLIMSDSWSSLPNE
ncbi:MAG: Fe-S-cluster containining protein [Pseudohongiellaceae bacterium]